MDLYQISMHNKYAITPAFPLLVLIHLCVSWDHYNNICRIWMTSEFGDPGSQRAPGPSADCGCCQWKHPKDPQGSTSRQEPQLGPRKWTWVSLLWELQWTGNETRQSAPLHHCGPAGLCLMGKNCQIPGQVSFPSLIRSGWPSLPQNWIQDQQGFVSLPSWAPVAYGALLDKSTQLSCSAGKSLLLFRYWAVLMGANQSPDCSMAEGDCAFAFMFTWKDESCQYSRENHLHFTQFSPPPPLYFSTFPKHFPKVGIGQNCYLQLFDVPKIVM